ncbi:helix-turn-helix transcriptional regulator [Paraeggerthella sp. Marseille-Q4926]|uniref:helix-turn-helix domain-containing protein n=1 Tax=Paraeggerthella sp. Marseille-Q4926 TaxID=2866587 RepID=UPI001CE4896C
MRKYRKARAMAQTQLAEACGLTDSAIRNYELCNRTPTTSIFLLSRRRSACPKRL